VSPMRSSSESAICGLAWGNLGLVHGKALRVEGDRPTRYAALPRPVGRSLRRPCAPVRSGDEDQTGLHGARPVGHVHRQQRPGRIDHRPRSVEPGSAPSTWAGQHRPVDAPAPRPRPRPPPASVPGRRPGAAARGRGSGRRWSPPRRPRTGPPVCRRSARRWAPPPRRRAQVGHQRADVGARRALHRRPGTRPAPPARRPRTGPRAPPPARARPRCRPGPARAAGGRATFLAETMGGTCSSAPVSLAAAARTSSSVTRPCPRCR
jgi:hypothetical protein